MTFNGNDRGGLLSAGGILSIIAGALEVLGGGIMVALVSTGILPRLWHLLLPLGPGGACSRWVGPIWLIVMGGLLLVLGILAIAGGSSAMGRRSFGLSLAGAICALPMGILGILAVVFVSLAKREFEAKV